MVTILVGTRRVTLGEAMACLRGRHGVPLGHRRSARSDTPVVLQSPPNINIGGYQVNSVGDGVCGNLL